MLQPTTTSFMQNNAQGIPVASSAGNRVGKLPPLQPDTLVFSARNPADALSSSRLISHGPAGSASLMILPGPVSPSLGHLGMIADISTAQAIIQGVRPGHGIRTLGLHIQLASKLEPGELVQASGEKLSFDEVSGLSRSTVFAPDATIRAVATGRFMVVAKADHSKTHLTSEPLSMVSSPSSWDAAYGIESRTCTTGKAILTALPDLSVQNHDPMMHGGMQVRALELAMVSAAGFTSEHPSHQLTDVDICFHRPVPVDGHTRIIMHGSVQRRGRRTAIVSASLETTEGRLLSSAEGTFLVDHHVPR